MESLADITLCADETRSSPLPIWLTKVAQWIGFAPLKFRLACRRLKALFPNGMVTKRARLSRFAISTAVSGRLRRAGKQRRQCDRRNQDYVVARSSPEDWLRHLGLRLNRCKFQLHGRRTCGRIPALFGTRVGTKAPGAYSAAWRGSDALSSAWPKSSIRSSTSSRPTDNRSRPGAMPSAARCSGLSR